MLNPDLLKEITHYLITDRQAINRFKGKFNKEFFEGCPALEVCVKIVHDHYSKTKSLMSAGELIESLDRLISKNKLFKNMIDEPVDLVNDIFSRHRYDAASISHSIVEEIHASKILEATNKLVNDLSAGGSLQARDVVDLYRRIDSDVQDLEFEYSKNIFDQDFSEILESFKMAEDSSNIITTGFTALDKHNLGLTRNGEIGIIVAPPNRGKTAILVALTRNMVMRGYNVLFITGETHEEDLKKRIWAGILRHSINSLSTVDEESAYKSYLGAKRIGGCLQFHQFIGQDFTPTDLEFIINKYYEQPGRPIDVVVLDYFDLMLPDKTNDKDQLRVQINKIYKSVRGMSVRFGIPIWTASQTNREGSDVSLITDKNIGEDWQKICNADKIISFNQTPCEVDDKVARFYVMKTRNSTGKNAVIQIRTNFEHMIFKEIRELSFKEHQKMLETLEQANRKGKTADKKPRKPRL